MLQASASRRMTHDRSIQDLSQVQQVTVHQEFRTLPVAARSSVTCMVHEGARSHNLAAPAGNKPHRLPLPHSAWLHRPHTPPCTMGFFHNMRSYAHRPKRHDP